MSIRKDSSGRRYVQVETLVPGTPEEVWQAIATGPGVSAWFVPTEKKEDGTVVSRFGPGMEAVARETAYEPPVRFAAEGEMAPGGPVMATEWTIEARDGGVCLVRVVHSLFASTDDWDDQLENIEGGWPDYFEILKLYLTHFRGQPCTGIQLAGMSMGTADEAWSIISDTLGVTDAAVGRRVEGACTVPPLAGVVERAGQPGHPHQVIIRLDAPTNGIAHAFAMVMGGPVVVILRMYLYGDRAAEVVARDEPGWQAWMQERFPFPGAPPC